ncbi:helix-turn-helix transcriptional regulator [Paraburkholderia phosphatilytica]|uniref:helix-turn-helix transcriptional regulator n=1 Tax=Paraburkholderia phosphatilytica TaxID=2282883 RepID=UPI000E488122|nr:LuxR family transcriptional regulator [Paraburkholderia phosphatilytica]
MEMSWDKYTQHDAALGSLCWFSLAQAAGGSAQPAGAAADDAGVSNTASNSASTAACKVFESASTQAQIADDLRAAGFNVLVYAAFETAGRHRLRTFALRDFVPTGFLERYLAADLDGSDPCLASVEHTGLPCVWDLERLREDAGNSPQVATLVELLRQHGLGSGVTFGMALPSLGLRVLICVGSTQTEAGWIDDRAVSQALMTGLNVHRIVQQHVEALAAPAREPELDAEEASVLDQLVLGLSTREISERLALSVHQVNHHVRTLQRKFHVVNRMQLAYVAGRRERLSAAQPLTATDTSAPMADTASSAG